LKPIKAVPTNIITGALGVGKTTLIQALLAKKPVNERWAVLVNEFGEVGIDGALISSSRLTESQKNTGIFVLEVPGGCMCCASGLPMQIALNQLLANARPHRLLIEPTGLGHPKEVLETLSAQHYKTVLDIRATLTLIDARKLKDDKWRNHKTFQEQLQIADSIVLTKTDLCSNEDEALLTTYLHELELSDRVRIRAEQGEIAWEVLDSASKFLTRRTKHNLNSPSSTAGISSKPLMQLHSDAHYPVQKKLSADSSKLIKVSKQAEGFYSQGWICPHGYTASYQSVMRTFESISVERLKAVIATDAGIYSFNMQDQELTCSKLNYINDSRIELITQDKLEADNAASKIETLLALPIS
jgi:G3E family GTPase